MGYRAVLQVKAAPHDVPRRAARVSQIIRNDCVKPCATISNNVRGSAS